MTYMEFVMHMQNEIQRQLGDEAAVDITEVRKNNDICLTGLAIKYQSKNIAPTIYLEQFYLNFQEGSSLEKEVCAFLKIYDESIIEEVPDLSCMNNYQKAKKILAVKLVNLEKNRKLLEEVPSVSFFNLAAVFYCRIEHAEIGNGTITVRNENLKQWKVTAEQLYLDAMENSKQMLPCVLHTIDEIVEHLMVQESEKKECEKENVIGKIGQGALEKQMEEIVSNLREQMENENALPDMVILTNNRQTFGASCILYQNALKTCAEILDRNLFILPSSVHEVILIPDRGQHTNESLLEMVREVNRTQVEPEEWLADAVYYYEREAQSLQVME